MYDTAWNRWVMQTATRWEDLSSILRLTGIEWIDRDHRQLSEYLMEINLLINEISRHHLSPQLIEEQKDILNAFYHYTAEHFQREEELIVQFDLPDLALQQTQHKKILAMLENAMRDFKDGKVTITSDLKRNLLEWVIVHINEVDFYTFELKNFSPAIARAEKWSEVSGFIRQTGVPFIDNDHRRLTIHILTLTNEMDAHAGKPFTSSIRSSFSEQIAHIRKFSTEHFSREENFIKKYNLVEKTPHHDKHEEFIQLIDQCSDKLFEQEIIRGKEFKEFLLEWWVNHINVIDYEQFGFETLEHALLEQVTSLEEISWMIHTTNNPQLDQEHQHLVDLVLQTGKPFESAEALHHHFHLMLASVEAHFAHEERIMEEMNHPDFRSHREEHRHLAKTIREYVEVIERGKAELSPRFRRRMMSWWIHHTNGTDYQTFILHNQEDIHV